MTIKLIPLLSFTVNDHLFCKGKDGRAHALIESLGDGRTLCQTGYLRVGCKVDLLGLSSSETLRKAGLIDWTDSISDEISLLSLAIGTEDGTIQGFVDIPQDLPGIQFKPASSGNLHVRELHLVSTNLTYEAKQFVTKIAGTINTQLGTCEIVSGTPPEQLGGLQIIGYRLAAGRVNYNRRSPVDNV